MKRYKQLMYVFLIISLSILADTKLFNESAVEEIFKRMVDAKELFHSGKKIKSERAYKEIENDLALLFPSGKIISSKDNCKFIKRRNPNLSLEENRHFGFTCLDENFSFYFESKSDISFSDKKTLTEMEIAEKFEDISEGGTFSGKIIAVSRKNKYPTYSISNEIMAAETIVINCKIIEITNVRNPNEGTN